MHFIGIDGCKAGWFYVLLERDFNWRTGIVEKIEQLSQLITTSGVSLIDIPIGMHNQDSRERVCDILARKVLKPYRHSSVFPVPSRLALAASDYQHASLINYEATGRKLSKQSWFISPKIKQVDLFLSRFKVTGKLREMHPEVCFWALNDFHSMRHNKKSAAGFRERRRVLLRVFPKTEQLINEALSKYDKQKVLRDDIVDALVGAVTAGFYPKLYTLPAQAETDVMGLPMEVVYAVPLAAKHKSAASIQDFAVVTTPIAKLMLKTLDEHLISVGWVDENTPENKPHTQHLQHVLGQIQDYWNNPQVVFDVAKVTQGSEFSNKVWREISAIPVGETRTYGELAKRLGSGPRAIGNACRNNPLPLIVPCHRVVSASGMGGYAGQTQGENLRIKRLLLAHEAQVIARRS